jgi:hypothetical protein
LRCRPDHEGKEEQDHEAHDEASFDARHAVGRHHLAVLLTRRWQSPPKLSQALLNGPVEPVSRASSFARRVTLDHQVGLYDGLMRRSAR